MSAHDVIPDIDRKGLRSFGLTTGVIIAGLFGLFFPWLLEAKIPLWPWVILVVLGGWALVAPASLKPVYRGWMRFGLLLSKITTPIIMFVVFFILVMPFGFILKILGKDPMRRRFDESAGSYRIESIKPSKDNLENPF